MVVAIDAVCDVAQRIIGKLKQGTRVRFKVMRSKVRIWKRMGI